MYPDLDATTLPIQLQMFRHQVEYTTSLHEAKSAYRNMHVEVRSLFPQVLLLIKLLLLCPVISSVECERSFSALRRLKTWLGSTATQRRLNHVALCNVHQERLDVVDIQQVAKTFAERSYIRRNLFGQF